MNTPIPNFYISAVSDVILRGDRYYEVVRIDTVAEGPDAGKRDVLTVRLLDEDDVATVARWKIVAESEAVAKRAYKDAFDSIATKIVAQTLGAPPTA